ncbi:MAG: hypothetical protein ACRDCG_01265 [Mycoplasmoidaceae bacterium]
MELIKKTQTEKIKRNFSFNFIKDLPSKIRNIPKKYKSTDIIASSLWLLTFILLLILVGIAAFRQNISDHNGKDLYANLITAVCLSFIIVLIVSIFFTVVNKYLEKKRGK